VEIPILPSTGGTLKQPKRREPGIIAVRLMPRGVHQLLV
jgi:hypothetical protein